MLQIGKCFLRIEMYALNCFYNYYFNRAFEIVVAARSYLYSAKLGRIFQDWAGLKFPKNSVVMSAHSFNEHTTHWEKILHFAQKNLRALNVHRIIFIKTTFLKTIHVYCKR